MKTFSCYDIIIKKSLPVLVVRIFVGGLNN